MTDYKGLFANKPQKPVPPPAPVVAKPKSELKQWIELNGAQINEGRLSIHVKGINPKDRESVSTLGANVTDLVRQQVDAVTDVIQEMEPVAKGFSEIKHDLNTLFERITPPAKKGFLNSFFNKEKEPELIRPDEVNVRFGVIIAKTELYAKAAVRLRAEFERLVDTIPSIEKQFAELRIASQYLLSLVTDADWVNKRQMAFNASATLQDTSAIQLRNGADTLGSYCDYLTDMKETLLPMWKTLCNEIALQRCANNTVDDKLQASLNNAIKILKEKA